MADGLRSWRERIGAPLREASAKPAPPVEAPPAERCWSHGCQNAAARPNPRWQGRWCQVHLEAVRKDAEGAAKWLLVGEQR